MRCNILSLLALTISTTLYAQTRQKQIDRFFAEWDKSESPGCVVAVIKDGELVFQKCYGLADIEAKRPIDEDTLFDLATLSRHFTGAAATWLIDNGAVRPTDSIRVTIPEMPRVEPLITVQDLIYHTTGLPDYVSVWKKAGRPEIGDALAMVDLLAEAKLRFPAQSRFEISSSNYFLLGLVTQRVTSFTLAEWMQNTIFKPAGMTDSVFCDHPDGLPPGRATGYKRKMLGGYVKVENPLPNLAGDTGLWTTIGDLAAWERVLVEQKPFKPGFFEILQKSGQTADGHQIAYASGLKVAEYRGFKAFSHNGRANGFSAGLMRIPDKKLTVICLSNLESFKTEPLVEQLAAFYLEQD